LTFGAIEDASLPLAVLAHGFPDTPFTWRHLGPALARRGYRVVAPWLPGYDAPTDQPISVGTYVRHLLDTRRRYDADDRAMLVGHDWGAQAGYGAVAAEPDAFECFVALAVPPVAALAAGLFSHAQLKRSFYVYFIQQVGMAEAVLVAPGFWESLWAEWSPGYDAGDDIAELRRQRCICTAPTTERSALTSLAISAHTFRLTDPLSRSSTASDTSCTSRSRS
jgi:pimeloyl-ACP methyl ester carboxylesterase